MRYYVRQDEKNNSEFVQWMYGPRLFGDDLNFAITIPESQVSKLREGYTAVKVDSADAVAEETSYRRVKHIDAPTADLPDSAARFKRLNIFEDERDA